MAINYEERSPDTVRNRANQKGGNFDSLFTDDAVMFKVKEGESTIRILPPTWSKKEWGDNWAIETWIHRQIGANNDSYFCLAKMKDEACPICDAIANLDKDEKKEVEARKRMYAYIIDRDNEKLGPQVWSFGIKIEKEIQKRSSDKETGAVISIDHPNKGYDITFTREGTKLNTDYNGVDVARKPSYMSDSEKRQKQWEDFIEDHPLPSLLVFHDADYLRKVFSGKSARREDDDTEERDPPRRGRGRDAEEREEPRGRGREEERDPPRRGREEERDPPRRGARDAEEERDPPRRGREEEREEPRGRGREEERDPPRRGREDDREERDPPRRGRDEEPEERGSRRGGSETSDRARESLDKLKKDKKGGGLARR